MLAIFSDTHRSVLRQFTESKVLLAFDFDGTLAPIVSDPNRAVMRPETRELLEQLAKRYPCIVISGRAQADVLKRVKASGILEIIGNHGVEPWSALGSFLDTVQAWRPVLEARLSHLEGVSIEDKNYSLAIHYRQAPDKKTAQSAILEAVSALQGVRVIGGKMVINVLPSDAPHKGIALERERVRLGCDTAIYVGDDETDEDVFALDQPGHILTIRVGAKQSSMAAYFIPDQQAIDELLRLLIDARSYTPLS